MIRPLFADHFPCHTAILLAYLLLTIVAVWLTFIKNNFTMDIDLTSVIISIVAFSFFIIPIVYDQIKKKEN